MLGGRPLPRHGRPVLGPAPRRGRGGVAVLALRRRRLDPAVLAPVPPPGNRPREGPMHLLRHPRNAAAARASSSSSSRSSTASSRRSGPGIVDYAGVTMLLVLGDRDGDHGLRARRRDSPERLTCASASTDRAMLEDLWNQHPRPDGAVRHPRLGSARRAPADRHPRWSSLSSSSGPFRRLRQGAGRRRGKQPRRAAPRRPASTCPGRRSSPVFAAIGAFLLFLGSSSAAGSWSSARSP